MKTWTTGEPRADHAVLPGQLDQELSAARASFQGLDRTQLPADGFDEAEFKQYAKHRIWTVFTPEQTNSQDTGVSSNESWRSVSARTNQLGWQLLVSTALSGHKGGNIMVTWAGNTAVSQMFAFTVNQTDNRNPAHVGLRIVIGGQIVAERIGPCGPHDHFHLTASAFVPAGDPEAALYWQVTPNGPDDPLVSTGAPVAQLFRAHLYASQALFIGRWR